LIKNEKDLDLFLSEISPEVAAEAKRQWKCFRAIIELGLENSEEEENNGSVWH
jgi:hypothetical protein